MIEFWVYLRVDKPCLLVGFRVWMFSIIYFYICINFLLKALSRIMSVYLFFKTYR